MERLFIQSVLSGSIIIIVYMLVSPALAFSAQQHTVTLNPKDHVRRGTITSVDKTAQSLTVDFAGASVPVTVDASTTISSPDGNNADLSSLQSGAAVYVFGDYASTSCSIEARKIVIRNPSIMTRDSFTKAQEQSLGGVMNQQNTSSTTVSVFSFISK